MKALIRPALLFMLLGLTVPSASAQVDFSTSLYYGSPYVWRGQTFSTGFVFQPTVTASYQGFSATFFGNIDPRSPFVDSKFHVQEADLTLAYGATLGDVALSGGYTFYTFPTPTDDELDLAPTQEVFASVGLADVPLAPSLFVAYDFDAIEGLFAQASIGHEVNVGGQPFNLGALLGLDSNYILEDETKLSYLTFTASTPLSAGSFTITPLLALQLTLSDVHETWNQDFGYGGDTIFYGGIAIGF